jgi:signal transduction histidine kinase
VEPRAQTEIRLPDGLRAFPGALLLLSCEGQVLDSNGRLEAALERSLVGTNFADALDVDSSRDKWLRALTAVTSGAGRDAGTACELVLAGHESLNEPREFSVLAEGDSDTIYVVEHPRDPRLDRMREQVTGVNSELANTQRDLLRERGRLKHALEELQQRGAELERSNRALDEFARVVSHDLKAPLRGIANAAAWVTKDLGDSLPEEARSHLDLMREQIKSMQAMIAGVLRYARAGRRHAEDETIDVRALLEEIVTLLQPGKDATITIDTEMPTIRTARAPLQQVFQNLLDNAIKHARRDDVRVRVRCRAAGELYEFSVSDNGAGIPQRDQERIWGLFNNLAAAHGVEGTGIGLAVVRRVVESQGGRIWVESAEGSGATFKFQWPAQAAEESRKS